DLSSGRGRVGSTSLEPACWRSAGAQSDTYRDSLPPGSCQRRQFGRLQRGIGTQGKTMAAAVGRSYVVPQAAPAASEYRASLPAIWSALIVVYLIWGSTYLAIRYAVETTTPFLIAAVRVVIYRRFL